MNVTATGNSAGSAAHTATPAGKSAVPTPADGGKPLPASGKSAPVQAPPTNAESVARAVEQINDFLRESKRQIEFQVDEASGRTVMKIVDAAGQVIRQFPSEEVLKIAATLDAGGFHSFNDLA